MCEKRTKFLLLGLILLIGHAGWSGCARFGGGDDEERPPIVINEASIDFEHEKGWEDQGTERKVWRPKHPRGRHVEQYDVVVTSNGGSAGCDPMKGKTLSVVYGGLTFQVLTKPHGGGNKHEPELVSTEPLTLDSSGTKLSYTTVGDIESVKVGNGQPCDVTGKPGIRITATPKNQ